MSTENEQKPTSRRDRRSSRTSVRTAKVEQYIHSINSSYPYLPNEGDSIFVKWIFNDDPVWWPASVLELHYEHTQKQSGLGFIQYHKFREYEAERARVFFTFDSSTRARFVSTIPDDAEHVSRGVIRRNQSSWLYKSEYEHRNNEPLNNLHAVSKGAIIESSNGKQPNLCRLLSVKQQSSNIYKRPFNMSKQRNPARRKSLSSTHQVDNPETIQGTQQEIKQESVQTKAELEPVGNEHDEQSVTVDIGDAPVKFDVVNDENVAHTENSPPQRLASTNLSAIETRISLLEQRIVGSGNSSSRTLSNPTSSVIASLRWSFLRCLEKPLKGLSSPDLIQYGVARKTLEMKTSCDYMSVSYTHLTLPTTSRV